LVVHAPSFYQGAVLLKGKIALCFV